MKTQLPPQPRDSGFALMMVMAMTAISIMAMSSALNWAYGNAKLNDRNNEYFKAEAAAEAGTEKVMSQVIKDFQRDGEATVYANLGTYQSAPPNTTESGYWSDWTFNNGSGTAGRIGVSRIIDWAFVELNSQYKGLNGLAATYAVVSNVRRNSGNSGIVGAVRQEFQVANIPIFQFAIFYGLTMEISCGQNFVVTGRVHSNKDIYTCPDSTLTFNTDVTAVGNIAFGRAPGDSRGTPAGTVTYKAKHDSKTAALTLPIGTNNSPAAVRAIIEVPPSDEDAASTMGKQRFFNQADMILTATNTISYTFSTNTSGGRTTVTTNASTNFSIYATTGRADTFGHAVPAADVAKFASLSAGFVDNREGKKVKPITIDVGALAAWNATNTSLRPNIAGGDVRILYVNDGRNLIDQTANLNAVRLTNGATLPTQGLTIATERPVYIQGDYNASGTALGTTNTASTKPAAVLGDAVTILSKQWTDQNSTNLVANRDATTNTVNAALLAGIVETLTYNSYSGGAENYQRFLEDWSGSRTYTYNGSMVILFPSKYATGKWGQSEVYAPPPRNWSFDLNFTQATKLPPGTPQMRVLIRGQWAHAAPGPIPY